MKLLLIGNSKSGKSTMSKYLQQNYGFNVYSLGDNVKYFVHDVCKIFNKIDNINIPNLEDFFNTSSKDKYRKYFQLFGTELCQKWFGKEIWCEQLYKNLNKNNDLNEYNSIVIDDCRFQHEYNYFIKLGFIPIKIERNIKMKNNNEIYQHISEIELNQIPFKYLIKNEGDLNEFYTNIEKTLNDLFLNINIKLKPLNSIIIK